ncbi:MAG: glycosyltransferase family 2 protein [Candidatus Woesearchaeota archaeon]
MKKIAAFTIVRDESYFLPLWIAYYKSVADYILVLDNNTEDGSTKNLDVDVREVKGEYAYDQKFINKVVRKTQRELLKEYDYVIYAEADEILIPLNQDLRDYIIEKDENAIMAQGYDVVQLEGEKEAPYDSNILFERTMMEFQWDICKTLIAKIPLNWDLGFHNPGVDYYEDPDFYMIHLHKINKYYAFHRRLERTKWKWDPEDLEERRTWHYWLLDEEKFNEWYTPTNLHLIPEQIKKRFKEHVQKNMEDY